MRIINFIILADTNISNLVVTPCNRFFKCLFKLFIKLSVYESKNKSGVGYFKTGRYFNGLIKRKIINQRNSASLTPVSSPCKSVPEFVPAISVEAFDDVSVAFFATRKSKTNR